MTNNARPVGAAMVDRRRLDALLKPARDIATAGGPFAGSVWKDLERFDEYSEPETGLRFEKVDKPLVQAYASLAVWGHAIATNAQVVTTFAGSPVSAAIDDAAVLDRRVYGEEAFPYKLGSTHAKTIEQIVPAKVTGNESPATIMRWLSNPAIRHEWTVKPGRRFYTCLLNRIDDKFRQPVCSPDGLLARYERRSDEIELGREIVLTLLAAIGYEHIYYPVAVTVASILVRRGLERYCHGPQPAAVA
jgi:hypothetical protein